ncbi:MAG: hypothetical protein UV48_C0027G0005 [Candidatus Azambacteria bacterium GW2011_GWA2_42_9]|uniref:UPF0235 protein UV48_C0027G0005 n=3 Tax=Candidatus Azamiibacteriota TaxID=1752741 RepID=A0A0G1EJU3_9BACT|nr:MAG: hypothetical protein UV48_C0027G0005 [Candidatus Azambacteria bacterium GW2011_GWA2_42_9]
MKIFVKAKPNSKVESIKKLSETNFEICVKEPPVKGRANAAIIEALAKHFGVSLSKVRLISGFASRQKVIEIEK